MKKEILILLLVLIVISGCGETTPTVEPVQKEQTCNSPYIEWKAGECCLDKNSNSICDRDEKVEEPKVIVPETSGKDNYTWKIIEKRRDENTALCHISSRVDNNDVIEHRYRVKSEIVFKDYVSDEDTSNIIEFALAKDSFKLISGVFSCPDFAPNYELKATIEVLF